MNADVVDRDPLTEAEKADKLVLIYEQSRDLLGQGDPQVTCPCGTRLSVLLACRCFYCGIFLCRTCSERHFTAP